MSTSVFISSTSRDLVDHRAAVAQALLYAGFHPIDMAHFMARPQGATMACLKEVAEADLFVGIYAWRYGYIPAEAEVSITEQEFLEAERLKKPCFIFMVEESYAWPEQFKEDGLAGRRLQEFKARLDAKLVRTTFTTPENLAGKVLASLTRWQRDSLGGLTPEPLRAPFTVPSLPGHFVERPVEYEQLRNLLLIDGPSRTVGLTTAFQGGGFGKTTLALALGHDEQVRAAFPDGVLFITLGENPANLLGLLLDQLHLFQPTTPDFTDLNVAAARLREQLYNRRVLLILDDVWDERHAGPFI
jgi:hypothetical protein